MEKVKQIAVYVTMFVFAGLIIWYTYLLLKWHQDKIIYASYFIPIYSILIIFFSAALMVLIQWTVNSHFTKSGNSERVLSVELEKLLRYALAPFKDHLIKKQARWQQKSDYTRGISNSTRKNSELENLNNELGLELEVAQSLKTAITDYCEKIEALKKSTAVSGATTSGATGSSK